MSSFAVVLTVLLTLSCLEDRTSGELFTAIVHLERILYAEQEVAEHMRSYVASEQTRLEFLLRLADDFERHSQESLTDPVRHLSNPVNTFQLVKRFTTDWEFVVQNYIRNNAADEFLRNVSSMTSNFPDREDLIGAASALLRLQDIYSLPTNKIAQGDIQGVKNSPKMTARDCYELGRIASSEDDHYHTILWMQEALDRLEKEIPPTVAKSLILDCLSYSVHKQGNPGEALRLINELLVLEPGHVRGLRNKRYYDELIVQNGQHDDPVTVRNERHFEDVRSSPDFITYERLCRGENTHDHKDSHRLTCQYRRHHPMFYIRPLKEEVIHLKPRIVVFYDVVSDTEISKVRELAIPKLSRGHVMVAGYAVPSSYRVSKTAWVNDEEDQIIARLSERSKTIVNLTLETADELQVLNYGIGGHYEPHYDFFSKEDMQSSYERLGNRMTTYICYMTDVEAGGATVFPTIGARVLPIKGACAVWNNLLKNGEPDYDTKHAGCPVLTGSKWVFNKWFHDKGQAFKRPCSLTANE